ncbi:MAG: hypothetical protein COA57_10515 [Flavobacteriales bacterium]|nr:MAG: hypothetical protein COA57_10515 [Flavobacteriales bacterium]
MKKLGLIFASVFFAVAMYAQTVESTPLKDHQCTAKCKEAKKCALVCGEKGHECTKECKAAKEESGLKAHKCTAECKKAGKCVTACGEEGHTCSAACKK